MYFVISGCPGMENVHYNILCHSRLSKNGKLTMSDLSFIAGCLGMKTDNMCHILMQFSV